MPWYNRITKFFSREPKVGLQKAELRRAKEAFTFPPEDKKGVPVTSGQTGEVKGPPPVARVMTDPSVTLVTPFVPVTADPVTADLAHPNTTSRPETAARRNAYVVSDDKKDKSLGEERKPTVTSATPLTQSAASIHPSSSSSSVLPEVIATKRKPRPTPKAFQYSTEHIQRSKSREPLYARLKETREKEERELEHRRLELALTRLMKQYYSIRITGSLHEAPECKSAALEIQKLILKNPQLIKRYDTEIQATLRNLPAPTDKDYPLFTTVMIAFQKIKRNIEEQFANQYKAQQEAEKKVQQENKIDALTAHPAETATRADASSAAPQESKHVNNPSRYFHSSEYPFSKEHIQRYEQNVKQKKIDKLFDLVQEYYTKRVRERLSYDAFIKIELDIKKLILENPHLIDVYDSFTQDAINKKDSTDMTRRPEFAAMTEDLIEIGAYLREQLPIENKPTLETQAENTAENKAIQKPKVEHKAEQEYKVKKSEKFDEYAEITETSLPSFVNQYYTLLANQSSSTDDCKLVQLAITNLMHEEPHLISYFKKIVDQTIAQRGPADAKITAEFKAFGNKLQEEIADEKRVQFRK